MHIGYLGIIFNILIQAKRWSVLSVFYICKYRLNFRSSVKIRLSGPLFVGKVPISQLMDMRLMIQPMRNSSDAFNLIHFRSHCTECVLKY